MKKATFPCWTDNAKIMLSDVIAQFVFDRVPEWSIFEISYVGQAPHGLSHEEFEREVRTSSTGYSMSHEELLVFAQGVCDIDELDAKGKVDDVAIIELVAHDSTRWEILYNEASVQYVELTEEQMEEIAKRRSDLPLRGSSRDI